MAETQPVSTPIERDGNTGRGPDFFLERTDSKFQLCQHDRISKYRMDLYDKVLLCEITTHLYQLFSVLETK